MAFNNELEDSARLIKPWSLYSWVVLGKALKLCLLQRKLSEL